MSGFQTQVNVQPAPGVEGDFCSANPRFTYDAGPGGLVAGALGVVVGRFAWTVNPADADGTRAVANNFGSGPVAGFVHREQQGLITVYLEGASMMVPTGFPVTLHSGGDFWVVNNGATQALPGMKAYANYADGKVTFAATGTPTGGGSGSASTVAAGTSSVTGSIADSIMTVTAVGSGTVYPGTTISGTDVISGTKVVSQLLPLLSGEALGGIGRYAVSIAEQDVASTTISGTYGLMTIGGTVVAGFAVGNVLTASGAVVAGTTITALGTGTGGAGTYIVDNNTVVSSQAISVLSVNVETKWVAMSTALPGELIKISSQPLG